MPLPDRNEDESRENFISRCMSSDKIAKEFPDRDQRLAVCMSKACEGLEAIAAADLRYNIEELGYTEDLNEDNFYIPAEAEYVDFGEREEEWDVAVAKPGLWENIRKKKEREGKKYRPAKRGDKDRPDPEAWKKAQSKNDFKPHIMYDKDGKPHEAKTYEDHVRMEKMGYTHKTEAKFKYKDPQTGEIYEFDRKGVYKKGGRILVPAEGAEYQGRKVKLNKPFRTPDGPKKFAVYTKNGSGKVVIVRFGDPNMEIKKDDPARRRSFRARHKCDSAPGPKWKARYWSCKKW